MNGAVDRGVAKRSARLPAAKSSCQARALFVANQCRLGGADLGQTNKQTNRLTNRQTDKQMDGSR